MRIRENLSKATSTDEDVPVRRVGPLIAGILVVSMIAFVLSAWVSGVLYDNDTWFILNIGRDVFAHGIPHEEQFGMFSGVNYVAQQWLFACLLWGLYDTLGAIGPAMLLYVLWGLVLLVAWQVIKGGHRLAGRPFDDAAKLNTTYALVAFTLLMMPLFKLNPRVFDILYILLSALLWQHYVEGRRPVTLLVFVPMAALYINLHGALWPLAFMVPFMGMLLQWGLSKAERLSVFGVLWLMLAATLLNPYSIDMHLYIVRSMGVLSTVGIHELQPPNIFHFQGIVAIALIILLSLYVYAKVKAGKTGEINVMWFVILLVADLSALMQARNYSLLLPFAMIFLGSVDLRSRWLVNLGVAKNCLNCIMIAMIFGGIPVLSIVQRQSNQFNYADLDRISQIIESGYVEAAADAGSDKWAEARSRTTILCYNSSPYLEFRYGYRCFADTRFEIWSDRLNGKYDYLSQVNDIGAAKNVRQILDQYRFDYVLTDSDIDPTLYENAGYTQVYQSEYDQTRRLFVRNDYEGVPTWVRE